MCLYVLECSHKLKMELPETKPMLPASEVRSLNHWTAGEVPAGTFHWLFPHPAQDLFQISPVT